MLSKSRRPVGITLLVVVFLWIGCGGCLALPIIGLNGGLTPLWRPIATTMLDSRATSATAPYFALSILFLICIFCAAIGFGLLRLRNWARLAVLATTGMGISVSLIVIPFTIHDPTLAIPVGFASVLPFAWVGWYCMRPRIRFAFAAWPARLDRSGVPVPPSGLSDKGRILAGISGAVTILALFVCAVLFIVQAMVHSSAAYRMALHTAEASTCVVNDIGMPLKPGWFASGKTTVEDSRGSAELSIPVSGPKGEGKLRTEAKRQDGVWKITSLEFENDNGRMQLIPEPGGSVCQLVNSIYR